MLVNLFPIEVSGEIIVTVVAKGDNSQGLQGKTIVIV